MGSSEGGLVIIPSLSSSTNCPQPGDHHPALSVPKPENGDEIGVFGAEKYFNMKLNNFDEGRGTGLADHQTGAKSHRGRAPSSVNSESSWNMSQTALITRGKTCPHSGKKGFFLSGLSCVGYCNKAKSVRAIDKERSADHGNHNKFQTTTDEVRSSSREKGYFAPKVIRTRSPREKQKKGLVMNEVQVDIGVRLEKRLSMLTWDAIPNAPPVTRQTVEEEVLSDGSSDDLFEIQNLHMYDAPSESSIEWSVMTASVADHDHDDVRFAAAGKKNIKKNKLAGGGGILGCKSLKALKVAEPTPPAAAAYTTNYGRQAKV